MTANGMKSWREGVALFLSVYSAVRHSESTRRDVQYMLDRFGEHVLGRPASEVSRLEVEAFQARMLSQGSSPSTVNRYCGYLKAFFNWLIFSGYVTANPLLGLRRLRVVRRRPPIVGLDVVSKLLGHLDERGDRYYADLIRVIANTGLRLGEALHLRAEDVDLNRSVLLVGSRAEFVTKDREDRLVPINSVAKPILAERMLASNHGDLFAIDGKIPHRSTVTHGLAWRAKAATVARFNWHQLRHAFVTRMAGELMPMEIIAITGHCDERVMRQNYFHPEHLAIRMPSVVK